MKLERTGMLTIAIERAEDGDGDVFLIIGNREDWREFIQRAGDAVLEGSATIQVTTNRSPGAAGVNMFRVENDHQRNLLLYGGGDHVGESARDDV